MGKVDSILQAKMAQVNSVMSSNLSRAGISAASFSNLLSKAMSKSSAESIKNKSPYSNLGMNTNSVVSTKQGGPTYLPNENRYNDLITKAAEKYDLDPNLIKAVMRLESQFKNTALSSVGATGLMQLMPGTAASLGVTDSSDPAQNIEGGAKYIRKQLNRFGDIRLALAGYYTGPNRVAGYGITNPDKLEEYNKLSEGVRHYLDRVMKNYIEYTSR